MHLPNERIYPRSSCHTLHRPLEVSRREIVNAILYVLRGQLCRAEGRETSPSAGILDSQSVKTTETPGRRGYDAGKKVKGHKRHLVVDTLGLPLQDDFPRLRVVWADEGYRGPKLGDWVKAQGTWQLDIVRRDPDAEGFEVLPKRWIVERTFAWLGRYRRLSKDYEGRVDSSETWVHIAAARRMLKQLSMA